MAGEIVEDIAGRDAGEEGEGVAQLLDPGRFNIGNDEVACAQLHGAYAVLVGRPRRPHMLDSVQLQCKGVRSCECGDGRVVIVLRVVHDVEGDSPVVGLVDDVMEDDARGATGVLPS